VWVILNNHELGIERKGADVAFKRQHPWTTFTRKDTGEPYNPDFVKLAEANGARGIRVETADALAPALKTALASGEPWVIDVKIDTTVPTFFTKGIDRAYPAVWDKSYPQYSSMTLPDANG
jgi:acetolactate synthase-1/2/3 large subunit